MSKRPIILFDVMETLVTEPFFTTMPGFFDMSLDELLASKHPTSWIEFEKGNISEDEYLTTFFRDGRSVDGAGLRECLHQSYDWLDGMEDLVAELNANGYELHALSNYPVWYELIEAKLRLSRYLDWSFVSCKTGVRKPDARCYQKAADDLQLDVSDCLFIDDRAENIESASNIGIPSIQFQHAKQLRWDFVQRGLAVSRS